MSLPRGETVTFIHREIVTDPYGDETITETRTDVDGCAVAPRTSEELHERYRTSVVTGITVYRAGPLPNGLTIDPDDQMLVRGVLYNIDGEPAQWRNPYTGREAGLTVDGVRPEG